MTSKLGLQSKGLVQVGLIPILGVQLTIQGRIRSLPSNCNSRNTTTEFFYKIKFEGGRKEGRPFFGPVCAVMASSSSTSSAVRALALELKGLQDDPLEGIRSRLINEDNIFEWEVALFGPPDTLYQGGYFKAHMKFPNDYPYSPPSVRFVTKVWHPNVYEVRFFLAIFSSFSNPKLSI